MIIFALYRARSPPPSSRSLNSSSASSEGGGAVSSPPPILSPETRSHYGLLQMVRISQKISRAKQQKQKCLIFCVTLDLVFATNKFHVQETVICSKIVHGYKRRIQYVSIFSLFSSYFQLTFIFTVLFRIILPIYPTKVCLFVDMCKRLRIFSRKIRLN